MVFGFGLLIYVGVVLILRMVWVYGDVSWFVVSFVAGCCLTVYWLVVIVCNDLLLDVVTILMVVVLVILLVV